MYLKTSELDETSATLHNRTRLGCWPPIVHHVTHHFLTSGDQDSARVVGTLGGAWLRCTGTHESRSGGQLCHLRILSMASCQVLQLSSRTPFPVSTSPSVIALPSPQLSRPTPELMPRTSGHRDPSLGLTVSSEQAFLRDFEAEIPGHLLRPHSQDRIWHRLWFHLTSRRRHLPRGPPEILSPGVSLRKWLTHFSEPKDFCATSAVVPPSIEVVHKENYRVYCF